MLPRALFLSLAGLLPTLSCFGVWPSFTDAMASKHDLWGEAAMAQTNGASYEFFEKLLPPPRYVNSDFKYYPLVMSAPNAGVKARLISNGSGINLRGGSRSWNEMGTPVIFRVGPDEFRFGDILNRLEHPTLLEGYLPVVKIRYAHSTGAYELEAFAATEPELASNGVVFVRFKLATGTNDFIAVQVDAKPLTFTDRKITDRDGNHLLYADETWNWERNRLRTKVGTNKFATLAIPTVPLTNDSALASVDYGRHLQHCIETWHRLLQAGMQFECPEPIVNHAWKNLIIQNFYLVNGDKLNYSAGNQYEKMYAAETSDGAIPLLWWGYEQDMRRLLPVIFNIMDRRLPNHFAGHKLENIPRYFWQTRDTNSVKELRPTWQKQLDLILTNRSSENGLMAKENYCTDIEFPTYSFPGNAVCWAALRDIAPVLEELGDNELASRVKKSAADLKTAIYKAVDQNQSTQTDPPFIPMALFYGEKVHEPITDTRLGSYWDLVANYVIGSRVFVGSERELWLPRYMEEHGGLFMGLTRSAGENVAFWTGKNRTNPLYGMRYILDCIRRDDIDRALVSFYGMLAHGMTRNTFYGAEGCSTEPLDEGGRYFYCPPNSASNGQWLAALRHLLVQDFDANEDGHPDTLRIFFGTPRAWLEDGRKITLLNAPTSFGRLSVRCESRLREGDVRMQLDLPQRNTARHTLIRARLPSGYKVESARTSDKDLKVDERGTADLSGMTGKTELIFTIRKALE